MKDTLRQKLKLALKALAIKHSWPEGPDLDSFTLEEPANPRFGHLATNAAMVLAKPLGLKPRELAGLLVEALSGQDDLIESTEVAGPGFINFRFSGAFWARTLKAVRDLGQDYGRGAPNGRRVLVEFVSANPTGPLHVGHGRGAALGDALARILEFVGCQVGREYYVNDAGRQIKTLGNSVRVRLEELAGGKPEIPEEFYKGAYVIDVAREVAPTLGEDFASLSEAEKIAILSAKAVEIIMAGIKKDLSDFRVIHETWFSERSLFDRRLVEKSFEFLEKHGRVYHKDGALWFKSTDFGDDKDRVLVKSDGEKTYFASDIAYHKEKFDRGYQTLIDLLGADHHGYVPRLKAAALALGHRAEDLGVVLVQLVNLLRDGQAVSMSTRSGEFVTLAEVVDEVGADAARFIFLTRSQDSPLDFDIELAKAQTKDNPVFYVQYVCARVNSLLAKARGLEVPVSGPAGQTLAGQGSVGWPEPDPGLLSAPEEIELMKTLSLFPDAVASAARRMEPHLVTVYLSGLAKLFHQYYGAFRLVDGDNLPLTAARLDLALAVKRVTVTGLGLLGVSAPEKM